MIDLGHLAQCADAAAKGAKIEVSEAWLRRLIGELSLARGEPDYVTRLLLDVQGEPVLTRMGPR